MPHFWAQKLRPQGNRETPPKAMQNGCWYPTPPSTHCLKLGINFRTACWTCHPGGQTQPGGLLSLPPGSPQVSSIPSSMSGSVSTSYLLPLSFVPLKDRGRNSCTFAPYQSVPSKHHTAGFKFLNCGGNWKKRIVKWIFASRYADCLTPLRHALRYSQPGARFPAWFTFNHVFFQQCKNYPTQQILIQICVSGVKNTTETWRNINPILKKSCFSNSVTQHKV